MLKGYCVLSDYSQGARDLLTDSGLELVVSERDRPNEAELKQLVREYDVLIIGIKEKMTEAVYQNAKNLKIIGTITNGLDHISGSFLNAPHIKVFNCPLSSVNSVTEHTFGLMLALQKKLVESSDCVVNGTGRKGINGLPGDLCGKKLGVIGAGNIASGVINAAKAFKMDIYCYTFNPQGHAVAYGGQVKFVDLETLLKDSDVVSVHLPLSDRTKNFISPDKIDLMKKDGIFINTSREEIADTRYLIQRARKYPEFRVGLDIDVEYLSGLFDEKMYNVLVTPHIAGDSPEARRRTDYEVAGQIKEYLLKNP